MIVYIKVNMTYWKYLLSTCLPSYVLPYVQLQRKRCVLLKQFEQITNNFILIKWKYIIFQSIYC